jgi:hypothetical protein
MHKNIIKELNCGTSIRFIFRINHQFLKIFSQGRKVLYSFTKFILHREDNIYSAFFCYDPSYMLQDTIQFATVYKVTSILVYWEQSNNVEYKITALDLWHVAAFIYNSYEGNFNNRYSYLIFFGGPFFDKAPLNVRKLATSNKKNCFLLDSAKLLFHTFLFDVIEVCKCLK